MILRHDQIDARNGLQHNDWEGLERKAATVIATTGVALGLAVNDAAELEESPEPATGVLLIALAVLALGVVTPGVQGCRGVRSAPRRRFHSRD